MCKVSADGAFATTGAGKQPCHEGAWIAFTLVASPRNSGGRRSHRFIEPTQYVDLTAWITAGNILHTSAVDGCCE